MELDVFKCRWVTGKQIVLGNFDVIRSVFDEDKIKKYAKFNIIDFCLLGLQDDLEFYLYMNSGKFIKITPLVIINNTIIFVFTKNQEIHIKN